jgi:hypothetical protein
VCQPSTTAMMWQCLVPVSRSTDCWRTHLGLEDFVVSLLRTAQRPLPSCHAWYYHPLSIPTTRRQPLFLDSFYTLHNLVVFYLDFLHSYQILSSFCSIWRFSLNLIRNILWKCFRNFNRFCFFLHKLLGCFPDVVIFFVESGIFVWKWWEIFRKCIIITN